MSSEYSDDFEEYTDDFEAYDSDKDEDTGADHHHVSPSHGHRQQVPSPQPPLLRPSSAAKTITNSASPTRGGLIGASPATNGVRAPTGFGLGTMSGGGGAAKHGKSAATAESARVKAIRKLVTFEYVNFTLLDMPPKSRYELALLASARVDGGGNRFSQKETQTGSDLIELAVQTEEVSTASVETQCPDDVVIVAPSMASGSGKEGKKDKKKASTKRTNSGLEWTPQLTKFVMGASQVFDSIMSAAAASDTVVDEVHDPHAGLVELFTIPIPMEHKVTALHTPADHAHLLAYSLCSSSSATSARSIIHITSRKAAAPAPAHVLTCWGTLSTLSISPHPRWLVLAGTTDGALLAWDLRKASVSRRNGSEPVWASYALLLLQSQSHSIGQDHDNASVPEPIHSAPIVAIHHVTDRSLVTVDELGKAAVWGISLSPTIALVPATTPTAICLFPPPPRVRRAPHPTDLAPVPYPVVTALDASTSSSIGLLAATANGSIVRAPGDLLVTSNVRATDRYYLPKSVAAAGVTCMSIVAREWIVVGTGAGHVCVFHVNRGAAPEVVWQVLEDEGQADEKGGPAVLGLWFPRANAAATAGNEAEFKTVVAVTRRWVVSWRTDQVKWDMERVVRVARKTSASRGNEQELVGMAVGRMAVWEPERGAVVVYNVPFA